VAVSCQTAVLPSNPLLAARQVIWIREAEFVLSIVVSGKISQDRSTLEDGEIVSVMVHDGWNTSVGRVLEEPRFLLNVLHNVDALIHICLAVCRLELLEENRGFVSIGSTKGKQLNARFGNETRRSLG